MPRLPTCRSSMYRETLSLGVFLTFSNNVVWVAAHRGYHYQYSLASCMYPYCAPLRLMFHLYCIGTFAQSGINLPSFFVAGDVSGDGHLDLVVVTLAGIVYLRNDGQVCAVSPCHQSLSSVYPLKENPSMPLLCRVCSPSPRLCSPWVGPSPSLTLPWLTLTPTGDLTWSSCALPDCSL